jgi:hypothetical protein
VVEVYCRSYIKGYFHPISLALDEMWMSLDRLGLYLSFL